MQKIFQNIAFRHAALLFFYYLRIPKRVIMYEKTRGIVLHSLKYGDDSMIVDIWTETRGNVPFVVKVPRSKKANVKSQLFRPLTFLQLDFDYRPQHSLQRLRDVHVDLPYITIPYEPMKGVVALFLGEVLYHALKNEERNDRLFRFLEYSFRWFDMADKDYVNFHLALLIKLTRYLGFWPNCEGRGLNDFFDLQESCFTAFRPVHGQCLNNEEAEWVPRFLKMNYATMRYFKMNRMQRNAVLDVLCRYYRLHIADFPALKSLEILQEVVS